VHSFHTHTRARRAFACMLVATVVVGCGDDASPDADAGAATEQSDADVPAPTSTPTETAVPSDPSSPPTGVDPGDVLPLVDAVVVNTIELPRGDLGFLVSDGEALWATGGDGALVRVDPDSGDVEELTIGGGLITGPLLPAVTDDGIWFSAIQGSHIVRFDPNTRTADPPIEVPGVVGLVHVGPGEQMWMEVTGPPAGLLPVDPVSGAVGEVTPIDTDGEVVGAVVAFDSMWVPLYEDRTVLRLNENGAVVDRVPSGVGPAFVREVRGMLWHPNRIDGTISRIDPDGLDVTTVDLNDTGDTIEQPSGIAATDNAIWTRAARLDDSVAIVFRIDQGAAEVVGRRTLPGGLRIDAIGGMASFGDRLFVLDRPGRVLLELDVDQFAEVNPMQPTEPDEAVSPDESAVHDAIRALLSTATTPPEMQMGIVDGDGLADQVIAFKQFFEDNLPGEVYEGDTLSVRLDGDQANVEFFVTVAGAPVGEPIPGTMVLEDGRWLLTAASFCRLVATGGIDCPAGVVAD
jgi:streptogramin lyase